MDPSYGWIWKIENLGVGFRHANGVSKFFGGPIYFGGTGWEWDAGWSGNTWICPAADYGTMTFDLIGNANFSSNNKAIPSLGSAKGTYMLYPSTNQLQTFGAQVIHDGVEGPGVANWYAKMQIQSLTDSTMQLIALKDANDWMIYNYVTPDLLQYPLVNDEKGARVYVYGNNSNLWMGQIVTQTPLVGYLRDLSPNIIRAPAGSVSDVYFWDGTSGAPAPADAPPTLLNSIGVAGAANYWYGGNTGSPLTYAGIKPYSAPLTGEIKLTVPPLSVIYLVTDKK